MTRAEIIEAYSWRPFTPSIQGQVLKDLPPTSPAWDLMHSELKEQKDLEHYIIAAADKHAEAGEVEFHDPGALISKSEGGAYVQCWVWVDDPEEEEDES